MNKPQLAGVALGLFVIIIIGIIVGWSGNSNTAKPVVITVDTVYTDTTETSYQEKKKTKSKKRNKSVNTTKQPASRPYLDQPVD